MTRSTADQLIQAARRLCAKAERLEFSAPVTHVYNPLSYAWAPHELYLRRYGSGPKRILFLGMNPGPFGMVQTGIPFGEIAAVRDWLRLQAPVGQPARVHPLRAVRGFGCTRSEVSGQRVWGLFAQRFGTAERFFAEHIVLNYCPLAFMEASGRNRTPDKLAAHQRDILFAACDEHLLAATRALQPDWVIGIGEFAASRAEQVLPHNLAKQGRLLHPSPANPAANRNWAKRALQQLQALGVWD